jgi:prepilin-type N-terminal cleavage/methylation domain-containing protein
MKTKNRGFTFIELIVFIVVLSVLATLLVPFNSIFSKSNLIEQQTEATLYAQKRMEDFLNYAKTASWSTLADPNGSQTINGYVINSTLASWSPYPTAYKLYTVTVSGNGYATLQTVIAQPNY